MGGIILDLRVRCVQGAQEACGSSPGPLPAFLLTRFQPRDPKALTLPGSRGEGPPLGEGG